MVDWKAVTIAGVVVAVTAAFVLVGAAVRFATRILSFAILAFLLVAVGYAVYELIAGWNEAATESGRAVDERESLGIDPASEERRNREPGATLSESEFERELEGLGDDAVDGHGPRPNEIPRRGSRPSRLPCRCDPAPSIDIERSACDGPKRDDSRETGRLGQPKCGPS